jgi:uncharacterized protein YbjT (DUF2867 family)
MNILVLGGTGPLGQCILKQLIQAKTKADFPIQINNITALVRSSDKLKPGDFPITIVEGNVLDADVLAKTLENQNIVIVSLGGRSGADASICSQSQQLLNTWAENSQNVTALKRLIVVTSLGTNESYDECNLITKFFVCTVIRKPIADKKIQEDLLREGPFSNSDTMDYVIVRPGGLGNDDVTNKYKAAPSGISGGMISRGDVAHFIVNQVVSGQKGDVYSNKAFQIVGA